MLITNKTEKEKNEDIEQYFFRIRFFVRNIYEVLEDESE